MTRQPPDGRYSWRVSHRAVNHSAWTLACFLAVCLAAPATAADCGRLPKGQNPTMKELGEEITRLSAVHGVPSEVIKAVAWQESGCQQWRANGTFVYNKTDCGLGMMQLTGATAKAFDVERLKDDWKYNLESGIKVLNNKWARAQRGGKVGADPREKRVLENWYYAIAYYWGGKVESYLRKIFKHMRERPGRLSQLLRRKVEVTIASDVIEGFTFGDKFTAHEGGVIVDKDGKAHKAPTHLGTIGDEKTLAKLDVLLSRGRKGVDAKKPKRAIKFLLKVVASDLDTYHKGEAEGMLTALRTEATKLLAESKQKAEAGDKPAALKLARKVARDYKGLDVADLAAAAVKSLK